MKEDNKKILVIEDEEDFLSILTKVFKSENFSVVSAKNGAEGVKMAEKEKPDLIISDILMPKMDGVLMAEKIREAGLSMPIIFLTNIGKQEQNAKDFDYFTKSEMNLDELVKKVKEKLGIKDPV